MTDTRAKLFRRSSRAVKPRVAGERTLRRNLRAMPDDELAGFRHGMLAWSWMAPHEDGALRLAIIDEEMRKRGLS